jgi:hypothetical protein
MLVYLKSAWRVLMYRLDLQSREARQFHLFLSLSLSHTHTIIYVYTPIFFCVPEAYVLCDYVRVSYQERWRIPSLFDEFFPNPSVCGVCVCVVCVCLCVCVCVCVCMM